jgi:hypothetical protein
MQTSKTLSYVGSGQDKESIKIYGTRQHNLKNIGERSIKGS